VIGPAPLATQTVGPSAGRRRAACERRRRARPTRGAAHGPAYSAHEIRAQVLGTGWVCVVSVARKARFCRYCSDRLAAPSSVSRPPRVSPQSATIHQRNTRSSNIVRPRVEQRIRSIGAGSSTRREVSALRVQPPGANNARLSLRSPQRRSSDA